MKLRGKGIFDNYGSFCVVIGKFFSNLVVRKYGFVEFGEMVCNSKWDVGFVIKFENKNFVFIIFEIKIILLD